MGRKSKKKKKHRSSSHKKGRHETSDSDSDSSTATSSSSSSDETELAASLTTSEKIKKLEEELEKFTKKKKSKHKKLKHKSPRRPEATKIHSHKEDIKSPKVSEGAAARIESMKPMSREAYDKLYNTLTKVYDPDTGRYRLTRGTGEIVEEIVSRQRQQEINKTATKTDGASFSAKLGLYQ